MRYTRPLILLLFVLFVTGCTRGGSTTALPVNEALPELSADASVSAIADHIGAAQRKRVATDAPVRELPELDRATAYEVQLETLARQEEAGARIAGWKLGGTRVTDSAASPDPAFGYSLDAQVFNASEPLMAADFVGGAPEVEAEIAFVMGRDLPGPVVSREELEQAIAGVTGAVEVLSKRFAPSTPEDPTSVTLNHAIADNLSHGGVILGDVRVPASAFDYDAEVATMYINGDEAATGAGKAIMGSQGTPFDALLWLANELPKHGLYLHEGDYVVTGSLYANPSVEPGDSAELRFSSLGSIRFTVE